jgi:N utilization substance protein A
VADGELLRLVDSIHRDKNIDREVLFQGIESALLTAVRKRFTASEDLRVTIDRETGEIRAYDGDVPISTDRLGRIAAQTAKQVILQKLREAESDVLFGEYEHRKGSVVSGVVARAESGAAIVNIGQTEGVLPASEQMPTETYRPGDRLRAIVLEVRRVGSRVRVVLSRTHPQLVRELFRLEVPEVNDGTVEIKALVREAGYRTKIAVVSNDPKVDSTGACVGVRGSRIKSIVDELGGEKIDVIRWSDSADVLIRSCLRPAEVSRLVLDAGLALALAVVPEDQLSLAIGRRGQNVRLASRLTGWDIEIVTPEEAGRIEQAALAELQSIEGVDERGAQALLGAGCLSARSVILLSDEDFKLLLAADLEQAETMRKWVEEHLPGGADHLPIYQQLLAQFEAQAAAAQAQAAREAQALAAESVAKAQAEVPVGEPVAEAEGSQAAAAEGGPAAAEPAPTTEPTSPPEGEPSAAAPEETSAAAESAGEAGEASVRTESTGSPGAATLAVETSAGGVEGSPATQTSEGSPAGEEGAAQAAGDPPASGVLAQPPGQTAGGEEASGAAPEAVAAGEEEQLKPQGDESVQSEGTGSGGPEVVEPGER